MMELLFAAVFRVHHFAQNPQCTDGGFHIIELSFYNITSTYVFVGTHGDGTYALRQRVNHFFKYIDKLSAM